MIYRNFRLNILFRVLLIVSLAVALAYVTTNQPSLFLPVTLVLVLIAIVINLIYYIEKSNKDLTRFLLSLRQGAFTESFRADERGQPFEEFSDAMNDIIREFAKVNEEKELHFRYLEALNDKISVAIFSFDAELKLINMNPAAKQLVSFPQFAGVADFRVLDPKLEEAVLHIRPDERVVVKTFIREEIYQLSVQCKEIVLKSKPIRIILLQNLNSELEGKEIDAWHQLIRVLTHEIMNSVTPIVSLTEASRKILADVNGKRKSLPAITEDNLDDVYSSLETINSRSKGLVKFVNSYKEYSKPIELHARETDAVQMLKNIIDLMTPEFDKSNIRINFKMSISSVVVRTDIGLMEQVIINLLKNAMEAVSNTGAGIITILIEKSAQNTARITISDNGPGIEPEIIDKIFIPFYTTKSKGSGIGLSFSRQILKLHGGSIKVNSSQGRGSTFTIEWR